MPETVLLYGFQPQLQNDRMKPALQQVNQKLNLSESDHLIDEYLAGQFKDDIISNVMEPIFKRHVNENELKELITVMQTDEYKQHQEHSTASSTAAGMALGLGMISVMMGDSEPIEVDEGCPKPYQLLFSSYYDIMKVGDVMSNTMNGMLPIMEEKLKDNKDKNVIKKCVEYMNTNMKTLMMNCSYEILTEDDLKFGIVLGQKTSYQHTINAVNELMSDPMALSTSIIKSYLEWLQSKGVSIE